MSDHRHLPELLCPAGSPEALDAAIEGGADAVYLGASCFNARMNAHNFGGDALRSAVLRAHSYGVKVYLTLNTLITDRETDAFVSAAREAAEAGVDALIVADLGGAAAIRRAIPTMELHASTQMSAHNSEAVRLLHSVGFSRVVVARETSARDLAEILRKSPAEIELFIHGALCVSHSGQCLFSSLVGGRSGNRGECAQPCRLKYTEGSGNGYPLSLKDLTLAAHVPTLIDSGVASLKIEGRMKSPEYVRDTTRIWRRLLDERRAATPEELRALAEIFSRGGFTDGYYTERIDRRMLGIRSEEDKAVTRALEPFHGIERRIPITLSAKLLRDTPMTLSITDGDRTVTVAGSIPNAAINAPLTRERVLGNLSKLGGTPYVAADIQLELDEGLMVPISHLNELRRRAVSAWQEGTVSTKKHTYAPLEARVPADTRHALRSARFYRSQQVTPRAKSYFDHIWLPLGEENADADGVILPPVIFDHDIPLIRERLEHAARNGIRYALIGNLGHLSMAVQAGMTPIGDFRLNVTNRESVATLEELGIRSVILSPELTLPQARDIGGNTSLIVYGRIPLMTLEKCVAKEISDCDICREGRVVLTDRRGISFPVLREWEHRSVIYNSLPTCMSDRPDALARASMTAQHFLFSIESPKEVDAVIEAFEDARPLGGQVRRI